MNRNIEYETGHAPVGTTPPSHSFPGAALKAEGVVSPPPSPPGAGWTWQDAGPPPGTKSGIPTWAVILISVGSALILACCWITGVAAVLSDDDEPRRPPATVAAEDETEPETKAPAMPPVSRPEVKVTGECRKKIIGNYGLLASITVDNPTDQEVTGTAWVRWRVLGDDPYVFSEEVSVAPDSATEFHVDEEIDSERWFRVGGCDYGWTPTEDGTD